MKLRTMMSVMLQPVLLLWWIVALIPSGTKAAGSEDDSNRGQYFVREPDDVTANLGDNVVFACLVGGHSVGLRQWTRNGFGLGTDASLPGFPRYSLSPDYSLLISPVAEADAGDYQCQVGTGGDGSPPMRSRSARLNVQVPPGPPHIVTGEHNSNDKNGNVDVVVRVRDGETAILECESAGGRPAATLEWWQDEVGRLPAQLEAVNTRPVKEDRSTGNSNSSSSSSSFSSSLSRTTVSSLRLKILRQEHHNRRILCTATNVASKGRQPAVASVLLVVQSLPRVQLGISSGVGPLRDGHSVTLHCQAVEGHPPPTGYAWYRDGRQLEGETGEFLTLPRLDRSLHNIVIGCEATNEVGTSPMRATKQLSLQYGPVIMAQPEPLTVGREGEPLVLSCRADSNPPPRYVWTKEEGENAGGGAESSSAAPIGFSNALHLVANRHTVGLYRCAALLEGWPTAVSRPARVGVLEPPRIETGQSGGSRDERVEYGRVGADVELSCRVHSLSTEINITWDFKGRVILDGGRFQVLRGRSPRNDDISEADVHEGRLIIRQLTEDDFGQYGCRADNPLGSDYAFIRLRQGGGDLFGFFPSWEQNGVIYIALFASLAAFAIVVVAAIVFVCYRRRWRHRNRRQDKERGSPLNNQAPILKKNTNTGSGGGEMTPTYHCLAPDLLDSLSLVSSGHHTREPLLPLRSASAATINSQRQQQLNIRLPANAGYYGNIQLAGGSRSAIRCYDEDDEGRSISRSSSQSTLPPSSAVGSSSRNTAGASRRSLSPQQRLPYGAASADALVDYSTSSTMSSVLSRGSRSNRSHTDSAVSSGGEDSPMLSRSGGGGSRRKQAGATDNYSEAPYLYAVDQRQGGGPSFYVGDGPSGSRRLPLNRREVGGGGGGIVRMLPMGRLAEEDRRHSLISHQEEEELRTLVEN